LNDTGAAAMAPLLATTNIANRPSAQGQMRAAILLLPMGRAAMFSPSRIFTAGFDARFYLSKLISPSGKALKLC
jgi:hypothetical protein